jgi:hypothetical protein
MPSWTIEGLIATSPRPGYTPGPELAVHPAEVERWVAETREFGVRSIICLIHDDQLPLYRDLPGGLIAYYREAGFEVAHVPTWDGLTVPYTPEQYDYAWNEFLRLPKPVLVHCSAGMDRTGRIVRHILAQLEGNGK